MTQQACSGLRCLGLKELHDLIVTRGHETPLLIVGVSSAKPRPVWVRSRTGKHGLSAPISSAQTVPFIRRQLRRLRGPCTVAALSSYARIADKAEASGCGPESWPA